MINYSSFVKFANKINRQTSITLECVEQQKINTFTLAEAFTAGYVNSVVNFRAWWPWSRVTCMSRSSTYAGTSRRQRFVIACGWHRQDWLLWCCRFDSSKQKRVYKAPELWITQQSTTNIQSDNIRAASPDEVIHRRWRNIDLEISRRKSSTWTYKSLWTTAIKPGSWQRN